MKRPSRRQLLDLLRDLIRGTPEKWPNEDGWTAGNNVPANFGEEQFMYDRVTRLLMIVATKRKWGRS